MRAQADHTLVEQIKAAHAMNDETYGMPRIRAELADEGIHTSRKRINRLMRAHKKCCKSERTIGKCCSARELASEGAVVAPTW